MSTAFGFFFVRRNNSETAIEDSKAEKAAFRTVR